MANTGRRKRLERTNPEPVSTGHRCYCCRCPTAFNQQKGNFPVSHSPMYRSSGYLPWCNTCVEDIYKEYCALLRDEKAAMRRVCMKFDLYWNEDIYAMVERSAGIHSRVRSYIGKTNIARYINKTFDDTLREEEKNGISAQPFYPPVEEPEPPEEEPEEPIDQKLIDFWGAGYTRDFYDDLQRHYKDWTGGKKVTEPNKRSLYKQICLLEVLIARDAAEGKSVEKSVNALNTLLGSMNLRPTQQKETVDADLENMPLGVGIEKWETKRPLPAVPENQRDVNGTIKNITTWCLGHLCKMVGVRNSYCKMYEDAMERLRVNRPEFEDEDDDTFLDDYLGSGGDADESTS